jgi:hypothetical protein
MQAACCAADESTLPPLIFLFTPRVQMSAIAFFPETCFLTLSLLGRRSKKLSCVPAGSGPSKRPGDYGCAQISNAVPRIMELDECGHVAARDVHVISEPGLVVSSSHM